MNQGAIQLEFDTLLLEAGRRICAKCGKNNVYATGGEHMDWCEPCVWELVDTDPEPRARPLEQ